MNDSYQHMDAERSPLKDQEGLFRSASIPFKRTKEEAWLELEKKLDLKPEGRLVKFRSYRVVAAIAAVFVLLLGMAMFLRFYTVTKDAPNSRYASFALPGGSQATLNAGSELTYYPLWWKVKRLVRLEGEAYFEVTKGNKFMVSSPNGRTEVLGTSFNIYSRKDGYHVACFTGSVRVTSNSGQEAILSPEYKATIDRDGNILVSKEIRQEAVASWKDGRFTFTAMPLRRVLDEIERQYDVTILLKTTTDFLYTGFFSRDKNVQEVLELVCKPFGLNFAMTAAGSFEVY